MESLYFISRNNTSIYEVHTKMLGAYTNGGVYFYKILCAYTFETLRYILRFFYYLTELHCKIRDSRTQKLRIVEYQNSKLS